MIFKKADLNENLINELEEGGKLIFIRHAFAPGGGDPENFDINECGTQRNLDKDGKTQARKIVNYLSRNKIFSLFSSPIIIAFQLLYLSKILKRYSLSAAIEMGLLYFVSKSSYLSS